MANYYCLLTELPVLKLSDAKPKFSLLQLKGMLAEAVSGRDSELVKTYFLRFDSENLAARLANAEAEIDARGNYDGEALQTLIDEARATESAVPGYPAFLADYVRTYDKSAGKPGWYARDAALLAYYDYARTSRNAMLAQWYDLNLNILNILTALIARRQGWQLADYVQGDSEVAQTILRQATAPDFGLTAELPYMRELIAASETTDPVEKERCIDALRWQWLEERIFFEPFDITTLMAYVARTEVLERWAQLDPEQGRERFTQIIEDLRGEARVPAEFQTRTLNVKH